MADVDRFEEKEAGGVVMEKFRDSDLASPSDRKPIMLRWRSLWSCAKNLYSNPANAVDFIAHPQPLVAEADRVYRDPDSGTWWWFAQQDLPEGASIVALIVYSDETNLSKDGSVTGWPVYVSLANISSGNRWKPHGRRLVALLPKVTEDMLAPGSCIVRRRMEIFQQALDMIMGDCMAAADKGEPVLDPYGIRRMAYPLLYAYVGDYPEQCKVAGTKSGHSTNFPCPRCMVHRKQLAKTEMRAQRTVAAQKHTWMEMGCLRQPTDLLRLETANSQHHVQIRHKLRNPNMARVQLERSGDPDALGRQERVVQRLLNRFQATKYNGNNYFIGKLYLMDWVDVPENILALDFVGDRDVDDVVEGDLNGEGVEVIF
ncbi:hypothetical protein CLOM_g8952 [Closterium sp. NIES-68]|nr:hypothetical protein CLOM_g8952 [Closterium sp. NIES-68]GJP84835.1 hypothetical protein CLOP_g14885 [Closterium sp. NIES-67]